MLISECPSNFTNSKLRQAYFYHPLYKGGVEGVYMKILSYVFAILIILLLAFWCFKLIRSVVLDFKSRKQKDSSCNDDNK